MNITQNENVGKTVSHNDQAAGIFSRYQVDFCCRGDISIEEAMIGREEQIPGLLSELNNLVQYQYAQQHDVNEWPIDLLSFYIQKTHHQYIRKQLPILITFLDKICLVHGEQHWELLKIRTLFNEAAIALSLHLDREESILFPFIKKLADARGPIGGSELDLEIEELMKQHSGEGDRFRKIRSLANNYQAPQNSCETYKTSFKLLEDFEADLHRHIHLENNILFKRVMKQVQTGELSEREDADAD